ncbi:MAG: 3-methyl-2-oxobutanoate hydroxymethyltransferase, partial [Pseudomonadales bacterium]|nr:3-methyl-2-oxobutanoate hydroxymethyltransferase [Pseudomonadales bacterium]
MKYSIQTLRQRKSDHSKFSVVAAYDASFTAAINQAEIEVILVGDSLGMVVQGQSSTLPVTREQMVYHTEAVARGNACG